MTFNRSKAKEENHRTLVIALFSHIEVYPPSLNALFHLAPLFDKVYVLVRNVWQSDWQYPPNVEIVTSGKFVPLDKVGKSSIARKVQAYVSFGSELRNLYKSADPQVVLLYDAGAFALFNLFAGKLAAKRKPVIWYHNHDVSVEEEVGTFSLMRLMKKLEIHYFRCADFFSLPNYVRLTYFPVDRLKRAPFIVPNYPSRFFFGKWKSDFQSKEVTRLIFQGHISKSNRIEHFIPVLKKTIGGNKFELHLAGPIKPSYRQTLTRMADEAGVSKQLFIYGRLPYSKLPDLTSRCDIGVAIYGSHNTMVRTMSTASNKIFEYSSVGLPVIINDREDLRKEFSEYEWIHFVEDSPESIERALANILLKYADYSAKARMDFEVKLNFENAITPLIEELKKAMDFAKV